MNKLRNILGGGAISRRPIAVLILEIFLEDDRTVGVMVAGRPDGRYNKLASFLFRPKGLHQPNTVERMGL